MRTIATVTVVVRKRITLAAAVRSKIPAAGIARHGAGALNEVAGAVAEARTGRTTTTVWRT